MEEIDEACLVTTLEVPALHQSKQIIQTLLDSGYGKNRIRLILNRVAEAAGHHRRRAGKDARACPIFAMVPNDYPELYETYAEGRMLNRSCELGKQMTKLAQKLAGIEDEKPQRRSGSDSSDKAGKPADKRMASGTVWIPAREPGKTGKPAGSTGCSQKTVTRRSTRS